AVALLQDPRQELLDDPRLILRKEESLHGRAASLGEVGEYDHLEPGAVDEERHAGQIADADEVRAALDQRDELLAVGLRPLALRDVRARPRQETHASAVVGDRLN